MLKMRVKLVNPFIEDAEEHDGIRVTAVVISALKLSQVYLVHKGTSISAEEWPRLLMNASHNDCLLHALESHSEEE